MNPLRSLLMLSLPALLAACTATPLAVQAPGSARSNDLVVHLGIMPAAVARARMAADATPQHQPPSDSADAHHLIVAVFDTNGARIEDATVVATHRPPSGAPIRRTMAPMRTGEVTSFGAEFAISREAGHRFVIGVARPGRKAEHFAFRYDNLH